MEEEVGLAAVPLPFPSLSRNIANFRLHPWGRGSAHRDPSESYQWS